MMNIKIKYHSLARNFVSYRVLFVVGAFFPILLCCQHVSCSFKIKSTLKWSRISIDTQTHKHARARTSAPQCCSYLFYFLSYILYTIYVDNLSCSSIGHCSNRPNNIVNSEGYSYVDEVPSLQPTQHRSQQPKSTSSSNAHREAQQQNRARRQQRRVTHNEKRYHSGTETRRSLALKFATIWNRHFRNFRMQTLS